MPSFITADGTTIEVSAFSRRLGPLPADLDVVSYVVDTMGFVWIDKGSSGCKVRLKPASIAPETEAALYFALLEGTTTRVLISWTRGKIVDHSLYPTADDAVSAISRAINSERRQRPRRFSQRSTSLGGLSGYPSLQRLLDHYRISNGVSDHTALQDLLPTMAEARYLLVERRARGDVLLIRGVGSGYSAFDSKWSTRSHGLRLEEQPDAEYGCWLATNYLDAMRECVPRSDEVDATIYHPRLGRRRFTYRRLMLPYAARGDRQFLLSASMPDPSVDLRSHQGVEAG